ncbi:MAG: acyl carrier protein [Ktedonobacterales bacterium]
MDELLEERIREVVARTFGVDEQDIDADTTAQTLSSWSSLAHLRLLTNLQDAFGVRFTMAEMTNMTSVRAIEQTLTAKGVSV